MIRTLKQWLAIRRLNKLVSQRRAVELLYMKRREAAKAGWQRRKGVA